MIVGYARTSTVDQVASFEAQQQELQAHGCEKLFAEQVSSVASRDQLEAALEWVRDGDVLLVTKLDRLARSITHLTQIVDRLQRKGVALRILNLNLDTGTATGKLMLNLLGSIAEFEREMLLERQRVGIARAKAEGKYRGRKPTARIKGDEIRQLKATGATVAEITRALGLSRASVYRCLSSLS